MHRRRAIRRILDCGADVVPCGHDHQEAADLLAGRFVASTAGTLCTRTRGGRPSSFNLVTIDPTGVQVSFFRWAEKLERFQASDPLVFARAGGRGEPWTDANTHPPKDRTGSRLN